MQTAPEAPASAVSTGSEGLVDASDCRADALRSIDVFEALFARIVADLALRPVRPAVWHQFPGEGGLTGLLLLSESHLTCHTFPERGFAAINWYCCRERPEWDWARELADALGARDVTVRRVPRGQPLDSVGTPRAVGAIRPHRLAGHRGAGARAVAEKTFTGDDPVLGDSNWCRRVQPACVSPCCFSRHSSR